MAVEPGNGAYHRQGRSIGIFRTLHQVYEGYGKGLTRSFSAQRTKYSPHVTKALESSSYPSREQMIARGRMFLGN